MLAGGVAVGAAVRTFPFRVYSFPTDIRIASESEFPPWMYEAESYLLDPQSPKELARFMGRVKKHEQGFNLTNKEFSGKAYPIFFRDGDEEYSPFSEAVLAKVDWA